VRAIIVYILLNTIKLRIAGLSLGVYSFYIVSIVRFILIESTIVTKLVVSKVVVEL
jgi:hypothetical protein